MTPSGNDDSHTENDEPRRGPESADDDDDASDADHGPTTEDSEPDRLPKAPQGGTGWSPGGGDGDEEE